MAIGAVGGVNLSQLAELYRQQVQQGSSASTTQATGGTTAPARAAATRSADFASQIGNGLEQLDSLDRNASDKATQAATGNLQDVSDYIIAATQAQTATELTTTVRNKALDAFNEIMRMPL